MKNAVSANGNREQYARAVIVRNEKWLSAEILKNQDSSIISLYAKANALVIRPIGAPAASAGESVEFLPIRDIDEPS